MYTVKIRRMFAAFAASAAADGEISDVIAAVNDIEAVLMKMGALLLVPGGAEDRFVRVCPIHGSEVRQGEGDEEIVCDRPVQKHMFHEGGSHEVRCWLIYDTQELELIGVSHAGIGGFLFSGDLELPEGIGQALTEMVEGAKQKKCRKCGETYTPPTIKRNGRLSEAQRAALRHGCDEKQMSLLEGNDGTA